MTFEEIEYFLMNLQEGDFIILHDFTCNEVYPVVKWYLEENEVEIWHGNNEVWIVVKNYPDDTCELRKACKAEKVLYGA